MLNVWLHKRKKENLVTAINNTVSHSWYHGRKTYFECVALFCLFQFKYFYLINVFFSAKEGREIKSSQRNASGDGDGC